MASVDDFLPVLYTQRGDPYVFGAEARYSDPNPPAFDCCLAEGSLVHTARGAIPIEEVQESDVVLSWDEGSLMRQKVVACADQGEQPVFRLATRRRAVTATANHPFLVLQHDGRERTPLKHGGFAFGPVRWAVAWRRLDEINVGDYIVTLDHYEPQATEICLSDGTPISAEVAWLLGLFAGDGTVRQNDVRVCVFGEVRDRARNLIQTIWGLQSDDHPTAGLLVRRSSKLSRTLLNEFSIVTSATKRVPPCIWKLDATRIRAYLDGYAAADGSTDKRNYRTYHSTSRVMVGQVRALHILLGDNVSNISTHKRVKPIVIKGKTVKNALPIHSFQWYPNSIRRGQTKLDGSGARRVVPDGRFSLERVASIAARGVARTFDLEIEGTHNFCAEGLVVHNSELIEWGCARVGVYLPDGSVNQKEYCRRKGTLVSIDEGVRTFGALLFRMNTTIKHVAVSLGNGWTFEARGRAYGVNTFSAFNRGWTHAGRIPGMSYARINRNTYVAPAPANQLRTTMDARDVLIHDAVGRIERNVVKALQKYGLTPAVTPNTGTSDGLQATQEMVARIEADTGILDRHLGV